MREFSGTRYKCQINILLFQGSISARNSIFDHEFDIEFASMYLLDVYQDLAYQDFAYQDFSVPRLCVPRLKRNFIRVVIYSRAVRLGGRN